MRADDLRLIELLDQDPEHGFPLFGTTRIMVMGMAPLQRLHKGMTRLMGQESASKMRLRTGYEAGLNLATHLASYYQWDDELEWLKAGGKVLQAMGLAREELTLLEFDKAKSRFLIKGRWHLSIEAEINRQEFGVTANQACDILCGVVSGYASAVWGSEILVREHSCVAQGHDYCTFEARPVTDWGLEPQAMRAYLSQDSVEHEVQRLREDLEKAKARAQRQSAEIQILRLQQAQNTGEDGLVYRSEAMARVLELARKVAPSATTVLIHGETGSGKELLARYLHRHSGRERQPFLAINCAALPPNLLESELFGHVKGAFTGADRNKKGLFVEAGEGTLFLDEVGELPLELQAKLLRALQEREVRPVGGTKDQPVKARIIAASNRELKEMVSKGEFREDLYFRLAVIPMEIPPLRQRRQDILLLARHFLARYGQENLGFAPEAVRVLQNHSWPGNVRELENAIEYAVVLAGNDRISPQHLPQSVIEGPGDPMAALAADLPSQNELVRRYTDLVLKHTAGNKAQAARILGIGPNTLWRRLKTMSSEEDQS
jgi:DNA-binding NtrC family response regulator/predicted hydrocarbon binding protein